jgi:hypothetical protein
MSAAMDMGLREEFKERGYIKVPGFFSDGEIDTLRRDIIEASALLDEPNNLNKDNMIFHSNLFQKSAALQSFLTLKKNHRLDLLDRRGRPLGAMGPVRGQGARRRGIPVASGQCL